MGMVARWTPCRVIDPMQRDVPCRVPAPFEDQVRVVGRTSFVKQSRDKTIREDIIKEDIRDADQWYSLQQPLSLLPYRWCRNREGLLLETSKSKKRRFAPNKGDLLLRVGMPLISRDTKLTYCKLNICHNTHFDKYDRTA